MGWLKVGIIDSGINFNAIKLHSVNKKIFCDDMCGTNDFSDRIGHGTEVTKIISNADADIELFHAKVFGNKLSCSTGQVVNALAWLTEKNVAVINMSFGLRTNREALRLGCEKAIKQNSILVAASPAQGSPIYPSAYAKVIRATGDARCVKGEISWLDSEQADFGAYPGDPGSSIAGASIGCAGVTAAIIELIEKYGAANYDMVMNLLPEHAQYKGREYRAITSQEVMD